MIELILSEFLVAFKPHASFGCDSGFFGLAVFVLCGGRMPNLNSNFMESPPPPPT
jgi:hypothetical protein